jgi:PfaB family protein
MKHPVPIAIVGMGGVFPQAPDLAAFERNILNNVDTAREAPPERWAIDPADMVDPEPAPDKAYSKRACFIEDFKLDPQGLRLDAELIASLDPMYHLVLHTGREAYRSAKFASLDHQRVGVYLAAIALPTDASSALTRELIGRAFERRILGERLTGQSAIEGDTSPLNARVTGLPASLLATALGLGGGSFTLDAACASSLYAIKLACDELRAGRADAMLAGGVSRPECLYTQVGFSQLRALSPSGVCRPFDADADGLVVGEGAGIVVLKRLDDAVAQGDRIHGVIRGIGLSNDIAGSLLAADSEGQLRAMRLAYEQSGWSPTDVDLIECHGTGTPLGDGVEIRSLKALWGESGWNPGQCAIGSVKSMIGHLLTGAGAAGLIKTLLAMKAGKLPPSANFQKPSPDIDLAQSPFHVQQSATSWPHRDKGTPRRAAVSAFGFGGINAHLLVEEWLPPKGSAPVLPVNSHYSPVSVAIVGMATRFSTVESLRAFQELVFRGESAIGPRPADRWRGADAIVRHRLGGIDAPGAYVDSVSVPVGEFRLPPAEIPEALPQQLLMLQTVADALDDAGQPRRERRERAGVFIGMGLDLNTSNFHQRWLTRTLARRWAEWLGLDASATAMAHFADELANAVSPPLNAGRVLGSLGGIVASRIAREFAFGGPSFVVSADEASGLRAVEFGLRALQTGELDLTIVGAVDLAGDARSLVSRSATNRLSRKGAVRPFDADADGTLPGEGATALVLKRLDDARRDGDRVYAVIKGVGVAGGGALATPSDTVYASALERAYADAGVAPASVGFLEAHASGHPEEDRAEAAAILGFFGENAAHDCALGSVKPNIGHTGAAAGLASVVKAVLCLYQQMIPPLAGYKHGHASTSWRQSGFHMPRDSQIWLRNRAEGPRRAGVSAMTSDGGCAHVVLEECDVDAPVTVVERFQPLGARSAALFHVTGEDPAALVAQLDALAAFAAGDGVSIERLARLWHAEGRAAAADALAVALVVDRAGQLAAAASRAAAWLKQSPDRALDGENGIYFAPRPVGRLGEIALVFPGSGNHYVGMGRDVAAHWPEIVRRLDAETGTLKSQMMPRWYAPWRWDWSAGWQRDAARGASGDCLRMIMGQVAHGAMMSDLLCHLGVRPSAAIGYSLGETASLFALRAWTDRDEMLRRMRESPLFQTQLAGPCLAARKVWRLDDGEEVDWRVTVVNRPADEVRQAILRGGRVYLLITNAPSECVIGGARGDVEDVIITLGCEAIDIEGASTVHCPIAWEVRDAYRELHLLPTTPPKGIRFYSAAAGQSYDVTHESAAESILRQALDGFDFTKTIERAYADGVRVFVEAGPQASCTRMIGRILAGRPHLAKSADQAGEDGVTTVLKLLASLLAHRAVVDLKPLYGQETRVVGHVEPSARADGRKRVVVSTGWSAPLPRLPEAPAHTRHAEPGVAHGGAEAVSAAASPDSLATAVAEAESAATRAHDAFLRFSQEAMTGLGATLAFQSRLLEHMGAGADMEWPAAAPPPPHSPQPPARKGPPPAYPREMCMEFAVGSVARVLGPMFAQVDTYAARVRLPAEPLMLVDRILSVTGEAGSLTSGTVVTEHDVLENGWYLDGGRMPISITVEAGQADLFLCSYLGIDLAVKGTRVYRLLDAKVTFHRGLPRPGDVVRYDIRIDRFVRQNDTYLFFFAFEGTIEGEPLLSMTDGCAGFFTDEEIRNSGGIIETEAERRPPRRRRPDDWRELAPLAVESYSAARLDALRAGDLAGCFGQAFAGLDVREPVRIPSGRMRLVHRVVELDAHGGRYGLGVIRAEADTHPDDWFLTCHFVDDMVMPGTLMYECCAHTLRILLMRIGWIAERADVCYEPVEGVASALRCRGPVTAATRVVTYEVHIKEIGYRPEPYVVADALMYADGEKIVRFTDMSLKMTGATRESIEALWENPRATGATGAAAIVPIGDVPIGKTAKPAVYDRGRILAFAIGKPSEAFGDRYRVFDGERRIARLPGPPYQLLDRVTEVHAAPWVLDTSGWIEGQYDVPPDAWYFRANRQASMPFAVLLEIALQPCGWLAAYKGSALRSATDLSFRNLGGTATLYEEVFPDAGVLSTRVRLTNVSEAGGMIIEQFDMQIWREGRIVYDGNTSFGFFSKSALAQQIGVRDASQRLHVPSQGEHDRSLRIAFANEAPLDPDDRNVAPAPSAALPAKAWRMIDEVECFVPDGGPHGLGFIRGVKAVDPKEWFFAAHFYQDPVCPGSLGLESFLQLLKVVARHHWGSSLERTHRFVPILLGRPHTWAYRGQVIPANKRVEVEAVLTELVGGAAPMVKANGFLKVDGTPIYEMTDFGISLVPV